MTNPKANPRNKPSASKKPLREVYGHLNRRRIHTPRGAALAEFAKAYPCHIERARAVANGRDDNPAMKAAWLDFAKAKGVPAAKPNKAA